jgi:hypothetical protein
VVLLVACAGAGEDEERIEDGELMSVVIQPRDLTDDWIQFGFGRQARSDAPSGNRADPRRFGRKDGWIARYRRRGGPETPGPLVIESRVDLFEDDDGARRDFEELQGQLGGGAVRGERLARIRLGDEALATAVEPRAAAGAAYYTVAWRDANVTASVAINGFARRTALEHAVSLARKQQRRIAQALGD